MREGGKREIETQGEQMLHCWLSDTPLSTSMYIRMNRIHSKRCYTRSAHLTVIPMVPHATKRVPDTARLSVLPGSEIVLHYGLRYHCATLHH